MAQLNYSGSEVSIQISNRTVSQIAFRVLDADRNSISQTGFEFKLTVRKEYAKASEAVLVLDGEVGSGGDTNRLSFPYTLAEVANIKAGVYYYTILKTDEASSNTFIYGKFIVNENLT